MTPTVRPLIYIDGRRAFGAPIGRPRRTFRQAAASAALHFGYAIAALVVIAALGIVATAAFSWVLGGIASGRVW